MNNHILIIRSNPIAPDPRVDKIARSLAKSGNHVDVLSWARHSGFAPQEEIDGYTVFREEIIANYGSGLSNLPSLIKWQFREFLWLIKHRKSYDFIHACDFDTVLPALVCSKLFRIKLVYDIFDFYADHLRKTPSKIKKIIRWLDIKIINLADAVILVDKNRLSQIEGSQPKTIEYIYNSPQDVQFSTPSIQKKSILKIVYVGLLQEERGIFQLLNLMEKHHDWHLEIAGFGGDEDQISQIAQKLPNVNYHGRIPYDRALELGYTCDVLYALYDPEIPNHKYASPNKIFEAMMLAKPVLVAKNTNVDTLVEKINFGVVVDYKDIGQIEAGLKKLENPKLRSMLGIAGRSAYKAKYSWGRMEEKLIALYKRLGE